MLHLFFHVAGELMGMAGMWFLLKKFKIKGIWAIVPIANKYKLAQCAGDEDSGAVWCFIDFFFDVLMLTEGILRNSSHDYITAHMVVLILMTVFSVINLVYTIRIYSGLCRTFGRNKKWVILWVLIEEFTLFLWGVSKKFQPVRSFHGIQVSESGAVAERLSEGLTININKRTARKGLFAKKTMLKDIHMNIKPGSMVLLLGGSGSGKTTFINAVTGYEKADASILLNDIDVYREYEKVIYDIGVVPQQELIRTTDTVYRTLMDSAALRMPANVGRKERMARVKEVMDIFGLTPVKDNMISKQSGGQKKRISIATEYISDPSLFILDEPDSGLDGILARELMEKLHDISREGKIVIVVTHTPDRVIDLFDEVIVLAKDETRTGRLVFKGAVDAAKTFFEADSMEQIIRMINRPEEGGLGRADELIRKFNEMNGVHTNE